MNEPEHCKFCNRVTTTSDDSKCTCCNRLKVDVGNVYDFQTAKSKSLKSPEVILDAQILDRMNSVNELCQQFAAKLIEQQAFDFIASVPSGEFQMELTVRIEPRKPKPTIPSAS